MRVSAESGAFDRGLVHQHDGDVVFYRIHPVALRTLQALRAVAVLEGLLARGTDQNFQQLLGNHDEHSTPQAQRS
jgi:hypothetical protein